VKYKLLMHVLIDANSEREANEVAVKLDKLLKTPMVRMAIRDEGIRLADGDGKPVVYAPTREAV
jgi:hypothetical protein